MRILGKKSEKAKKGSGMWVFQHPTPLPTSHFCLAFTERKEVLTPINYL
jgi:hypothetical protein